MEKALHLGCTYQISQLLHNSFKNSSHSYCMLYVTGERRFKSVTDMLLFRKMTKLQVV